METNFRRKNGGFKKGILLLMISMFILTTASIPTFALNQTRQSITEGTYSIHLHDDSNKVVNVIYASKAEDKAELGVDPYNGESNEKFIIRHRGNNYYSIHPTHCDYLAVNALLGNRNPGDKVTLHRYENNDNCSLWSFHKNNDGTYTIRNKHTGLVWDITNGDYTVGNRMINWTSNDYLRAQAFSLTRRDTSSVQLNIVTPSTFIKNNGRASISEGTYSFRLHDDTNKAVNVIYASKTEDKAELGVDPYNSENNEIFIIKHRGDNFYSIHPKHCSSLAVNALLGRTTPGDKVTLHRYENNDSCSLWGFYQRLDGSYTIKNKKTGLAWDIKDGNYTVGNRMINWTSNDYLRAQAFYLKKISTDTKVDIYVNNTQSGWRYPMNNWYCTWTTKTDNSWSVKNQNKPANRNDHVGIDIRSDKDSGVYAAASGTVVYKGYSSGNGNHVILSHNVNGTTVKTLYSHLSSYSNCPSVGKSVTVGQKIGVYGKSGLGNVKNGHLHFAIFKGSSNDPVGYASSFSGNKTTYSSHTFYNPNYVITYNKLP